MRPFPIVCACIVDFPQVHTVTRFVASEPDELDLEEADVVSVYQKSPDGQFVVVVFVIVACDLMVLQYTTVLVHMCMQINEQCLLKMLVLS